MNKFTALILSATLGTVSQLSLAATNSQPADSDGSKQMIVRYADLDLARTTGASVLFHRIQKAAEIVCSPLESRDPARYVMFRRCVSDAMARAVTQVDRPSLNAYYRGKAEGGKDTTFEVASSNQGPAR